MSWSFNSKAPIFSQITEIISLKIIKGEYKCGEKLPSVRDFAFEAGVNPNTVQRSLSEIENLGLIVSRWGDGSYITDNQEIINKTRQEYADKIINDFIKSMHDIGIDNKDIIQIIKSK